MARYLISFDEGWMNFPDEDLPAVADAAHAVIQEARDAGVFVFTGGLPVKGETTVVTPDGAVSDGPYPETKEVIGGFVVVDVATRAEAGDWAKKVAASCRCAQEVREFLPDPLVED